MCVWLRVSGEDGEDGEEQRLISPRLDWFQSDVALGPVLGAGGDSWDATATNGLKLMLLSLTSQIYYALQMAYISLSPPIWTVPFSLFHFSAPSICYLFRPSCFSISISIPLPSVMSKNVFDSEGIGSILHSTTMVNHCHQSNTSWDWSWVNCT